MKITAGSNITRMWKEPLNISREKCIIPTRCSHQITLEKKMKMTV
jgi:hypothetical protein